MDTLGHAESFRDLLVYKKARSVSVLIFKISKTFPSEEKYSLIDQMRRSSRSIGAQIAEAWAKRRYEKHFVTNSVMLTANNLRLSTGLILLLIVNIWRYQRLTS